MIRSLVITVQVDNVGQIIAMVKSKNNKYKHTCTIMLYKINKCTPRGSDTGSLLHEEGVTEI